MCFATEPLIKYVVQSTFYFVVFIYSNNFIHEEHKQIK